jgi:hypothetical protein
MKPPRSRRAERRRISRAFRPSLEWLEHRFAPAVLSDNLANVTGGVEAASDDRWLASSFGTDANEYDLTTVELLLANPVSGSATLSIYTDDGLQPGSLVGMLTPPASYSSTLATTTFTASGIALAASSTYWVVLRADSGQFNWAWTNDNTGSGAGFQHTFGDTDDAGDTWFTFDIFPTQMRVTADVPGSAGITVSPTSGLTTTEAGGTATFTVVLDSQPTANVTIAIASNDTTEGAVSASSLVFTSANWNTAQTVTIAGVDDAVDDGNVGYSIVTGAATSSDSNYSGLDASDVSATNTDNDTAGITVSPTTGLTTTEAGGTASFTVVLNSQPTADVTIAISSSDTTEGTVSASSLTFTAADWTVPQTVTVTGADDLADDGDIAFSIMTAPAASADSNYTGLDAADVSVANSDDDAAGITVSPIIGLATTEPGGTTSFTLVLDLQPTADVTVAIASADDVVVPLDRVTYDAALNLVTLNMADRFTTNKFYQLSVDDAVLDSNGNAIDGDGDDSFGDAFVATVGVGSRFSYVDSGGDLVSLRAKRATIELVRDATGEGRSLTLSGVRPGASLSGSVLRSAGGDGLTHFDTVRGTAGVNLTRFTQPPFVVANPIAADVVDRLLDSTHSALDLLADSISNGSTADSNA